MNLHPGATKLSLQPPNIKCPHRLIQFPAGVVKWNDSYGFGFRPNRGGPRSHFNGGPWENRVPFRDSQRISAASGNRGQVTSVGEYIESRYRRVEPVTPQNSVLSDGYLSGRCLDSSKEAKSKSKAGDTSLPKVKKARDDNHAKLKTRTNYEGRPIQSVDLDTHIIRRRKSPQGDIHFQDTTIHRGKSSDQLNLGHLRWSTSAIGESPRSPKINGSQISEGHRKIGPQYKNLCVRSEFTFSTYDFYNKHNTDSWFNSTVPGKNKKVYNSELADEETKLAELRNYRRIFTHDGIQDLVKVLFLFFSVLISLI
ncbi:hypothetical protein ElyMa_001503900 [Elysia marginata]|uniref:Uncharacterized protein n=1 Tax=Elysia marginata TaxID=1093978 RepID=A0AAV4J638_9GAST|nr:hypothetical protein ElyMa_001503900 [Elysia marginata]